MKISLEQIESMECNVLTVKQVAEFLGKDPQTIRDQAEAEPKYLGFPICKAGHSWCIPRIGFINWAKGMTPIAGYVLLETDAKDIGTYVRLGYPKISLTRFDT